MYMGLDIPTMPDMEAMLIMEPPPLTVNSPNPPNCAKCADYTQVQEAGPSTSRRAVCPLGPTADRPQAVESRRTWLHIEKKWVRPLFGVCVA